jgi:hypothetical protein
MFRKLSVPLARAAEVLAGLLESGLRLHNGIRPHRQRNAEEHCDNSCTEAQAQGLMQQERADDRRDDWIDGDGDSDARRRKVLLSRW